MKAFVTAAVSSLLVAASAAEAKPQPTAASRSPEVSELGYYVGTWEGHGETEAGPFGRAGKLSSRQTCKWFAGGNQVICEGEERGPSGRRQFLNILAYDESAKAYTEYSVSSRGETEYDKGGSLVGGKLTFVVDQDADGKPAKFRYSEMHLSPVLYAYEAQVSVAGGPWTVLARGKIAKVK